jgi:hypothetical protein
VGAVADRERLVRSLVRLRRAEHAMPENPDLLAVERELEAFVGATVTPALAARVLGVSHPALRRRIDSGDIPVVITRRGRSEVPLLAVVDLAAAVGEVTDKGTAQSALGAVVDARRREAERLDPREILPRRYLRDRDRHGHRRGELRALAYHRAVAMRLDERMVRQARALLERWRSDGKIDPRYAQAWERLLGQPIPTVRRAIITDSQRGRDLRQNSPFAGALTEQERRRALDAAAAP